jgi:hypothetical protein
VRYKWLPETDTIIKLTAAINRLETSIGDTVEVAPLYRVHYVPEDLELIKQSPTSLISFITAKMK